MEIQRVSFHFARGLSDGIIINSGPVKWENGRWTRGRHEEDKKAFRIAVFFYLSFVARPTCSGTFHSSYFIQHN